MSHTNPSCSLIFVISLFSLLPWSHGGMREEKGHEKWADLTNGEICLSQIVHDNADHNHDVVDFPIPMRQKVGREVIVSQPPLQWPKGL